MKCPKCKSKIKKVKVSIEDSKTKIWSSQCTKCGYFAFDKEQSSKILNELKEHPLKIKQKIVKISNNRLGMYFNKHIIESLALKSGEEIYVTVPDRKHILLIIKN